MAYRLADLAQRFNAELRGDGDRMIMGVGTLQQAESGQLAFLANAKYRQYLAGTRAGAVVLAPGDAAECPVPVLVAANPYALYARIAALFEPQAREQGIHPAAHVDAGAKVHSTATVGPGCVIEQGAEIGADSWLVANVTVCRGAQIGKRVLIHPGAVIGADGFGLANEQERWIKVPQLGTVRIADDVEIGANTTIDRGALDDTVIEEGVKLDNQIQIAHNVRIGAHTAVAGCTAIAGSTTIGRHCMIAGGVGIAGHLEICDRVTVQAMTLVTRSITRPGIYSGSLPMDNVERWRKNSARFRHLDELARRIAALEKKLNKD